MKTRKTFYEQNGGTYTQVGDVLLPNLTIGEDGQQPIGKHRAANTCVCKVFAALLLLPYFVVVEEFS